MLQLIDRQQHVHGHRFVRDALGQLGVEAFDVGPVGWHQVFAAFKLAVIIQQIYIRFLRGQTQDRRFRTYGNRVLGLAAKAQTLIS